METRNRSSNLVERTNVLLTQIAKLNSATFLRDRQAHQVALKANQRLLSEAAVHIERIDRNAPHFNVFQALGVVRKELTQSRFLAFLLSPTAEHGQKNLFLNAFLKTIGVPHVDVALSKQIQVQTELAIGINGRLDIVVKGPGFLVAIENKVDAGEQAEQLPRYQTWLHSDSHGINCKYRELVFLTPTGYEAATGKGLAYRRMAYLELASIFESVVNLVDISAVRFSIEQYITACRMVSLGMRAMTKIDPELLTLLTSQEHLATALELQNQMAVIREKAALEFADHVVAFLTEQLVAAGVNQEWVAERQNNWDTAVLIRPRSLTEGQRSYLLVASGTVIPNGKGWYGWRWPLKPFDYRDPSAQAEAKLAKQMTEVSGGKTDGEAIWFKRLRGDAGTYDSTSNEDMVKIIEDNRSADHSLAKAIANELSEAFFKWKDEIKKLPSFLTA
jgi:hypothetical protein